MACKYRKYSVSEVRDCGDRVKNHHQNGANAPKAKTALDARREAHSAPQHPKGREVGCQEAGQVGEVSQKAGREDEPLVQRAGPLDGSMPRMRSEPHRQGKPRSEVRNMHHLLLPRGDAPFPAARGRTEGEGGEGSRQAGVLPCADGARSA